MQKIWFGVIGLLILFGCGDSEDVKDTVDENSFVGTWRIESLTLPEEPAGLGEPVDSGDDELDEFAKELEEVFLEIFDELTKMTVFTFDIIGTFTATIFGEPAGGGIYSVSGDTYTMEFTHGSMFEDNPDDNVDSGIWVRSGNTLTLKSRDGGKMVLKLI